jgi:hypothetical protein
MNKKKSHANNNEKTSLCALLVSRTLERISRSLQTAFSHAIVIPLSHFVVDRQSLTHYRRLSHTLRLHL